MKDLRTIDLDVHGFTLNVCSNGSGACVSNLHDENASAEWNASVNALESLVLAHALAGVDVEEPAYLEGLETAVEAISQDIGGRPDPEDMVEIPDFSELFGKLPDFPKIRS